MLAAAFGCLAAGLSVQAANALELFGFRLFGGQEDAAVVVDPVNYAVSFVVEDGDEDLAERLRNVSLLVREEDEPVSGSLGLLARARDDRQRLVAALYEAARYGGIVDIWIEGRHIDDLPPDATFDTSQTVAVDVRVRLGPVFVLGDITVRGGAETIAPAAFGLVPGGDASSLAILRASEQMVRMLKEQGRPLARVAQRTVVADQRTRRLDVEIVLEAGPVAPFGETRVTGADKVDPAFIEYMTDIEPGTRYSPEKLEEARERLIALDVFGSVVIREGPELDPAGTLPIGIEVSERKHRFFGFGATVSSTEGLGLEGYWGHRNLFGRAEKLRLEGSVSRIGDTAKVGELDYRAAILFEKPGVLGPASRFTADLKSAFEHPDAFDRLSVGGGIGLSYEVTKEQTVSAQLRLDWARIEDAFGLRRYLIASTPLQWVYDAREQPLDPARGFRLLAFAEPAHDFYSGATFVKIRGEASAYHPLDEDERYVLAGRVAAGTIAGAELSALPADRRFYAGGGGSVRGYGFQGIGPRDATGKPTGGRSHAEASLELRLRVTETIGIVPFIDAGTVSTDPVPDFSDVRFGAGLGLRYATPFGPIRLDVAVPLDRRPGDPTFGVYAGIGQAF
jgi:translocation and assembly module TamA